MAISVQRLHHYTLLCAEDEIEEVRKFYEGILGLAVGARPPLHPAGYWLYAGGAPIVHLVISEKVASPANTGFDHVAFLGINLAQSRQYLLDQGIPFEEAPVPERPLHQVFVRDPLGLKLELTFNTDIEV